MKIQPAAGDDRSSTKVVLAENENPAGRRRRPFQYYSCTSRESRGVTEAACVDDRLDIQRWIFHGKTIPTSKNDTPSAMSALGPLGFAARSISFINYLLKILSMNQIFIY